VSVEFLCTFLAPQCLPVPKKGVKMFRRRNIFTDTISTEMKASHHGAFLLLRGSHAGNTPLWDKTYLGGLCKVKNSWA